jgi:hypothetical protein
MPLFESITDLHAGASAIRRRRYGVIEMADGRLKAVHLRPWPKMISLGEIWLQEMIWRRTRAADRCLLYYDQPLRLPKYLALKYVVSSRGATFATARGAALVLDEIARIKQIDAIVCDAWNRRISDRLLRRWGWERHVPHSRRRHYIKRFYGRYPENPDLGRYLNTNPMRQRGGVGDAIAGRESPSLAIRVNADEPELGLPPWGTHDYYSAPLSPAPLRLWEDLSPCDPYQAKS